MLSLGVPSPPSRGLLVVLVLSVAAFAGCVDTGAPPEDDPRTSGFDGPDRPDFTEARAVVAVVDTGINPYHETFRSDRDWSARAALTGYPEHGLVLPLTLDAVDLEAAHDADQGLWDRVEEETLYEVPGTSIVGLIAFGEATPRSANAPRGAPGLDEVGHGTASAGMVAEACPACSIVAVEVAGATEGRRALSWLETQSWVDIVVYPARAGIGFAGAGLHNQEVVDAREFQWARGNAELGQVVVVASGNGGPAVAGAPSTAYSPIRDLSYSYWTAGPDWVLTVGAAAADRAEATAWHTFPVDVIARGLGCDAPHPFSLTERVAFEGTSCSAPIVAGQLGGILRATRDAVQDGATGPRSGQRLVVPATIEGTTVTREDLVRAYLLTAGPLAATDAPLTLTDPLDPKGWSTGDGRLSPLFAGWGLHTDQTLPDVVQVLIGMKPAPEPGEDEASWFAVDQRVRLGLWGEWDAGESRFGFPAAYEGPVKVPKDVTELEALYAANRVRG